MLARTLEDTRKIAQTYAEENIPVLALLGELGAGKTTFAQFYAQALGVEEDVLSPTFSIVREYDMQEGKLYHCDLYRVEDPEELEAFGFEEYFHEDAKLIIEWPQIAQDYLQDAVYLEILVDEEGNRIFRRLP
jgi:tRNA threonylcarbamoyladenosine biosynthesis protein TsaE